MSKFITDTRVKKGRLAISGVPFKDNQDVRVIIIPRANLQKMAYKEAQKLSKSIPGNLSDDIRKERESP